MTRIDSHIHLFEHGYSGDRPAGAELADYEVLRQRHGIDRALVVGFEGDTRFSGNNDYLLGLARLHDWILPLSYLDLATASADTVSTAVADGAVGFSLYLGADPTLASRVRTEVWRAIDRHGSILSVNATPAALAAFGAVLDQLPGSTVLISHLGLPGPVPANQTAGLCSQSQATSRMSELIDLARYPQVAVKLSGLYAIDSEFPHARAEADVRASLEAFGTERLVWGSDFSPGLDVLTADELFAIPDWIASELSADELAGVTGDMLERMLEES